MNSTRVTDHAPCFIDLGLKYDLLRLYLALGWPYDWEQSMITIKKSYKRTEERACET